MALIRPALLAALIYLGFTIAYPDYVGTTYHVMVPALIAGGVVALFLLRKVLGLVEGTAHVLIEVAFLAAVAGFVGYTMPQKSGKAPLEQWAEGARPTRDSARKGLSRLGMNPDAAPGSFLVGLFPKR